LNLLGAASNEGPGLLRKRVAVDITLSQFHLGVLGPCDEMQLKPHYPASQERLSRDGDKRFLMIGPPAEVRLIGRIDRFDTTKDTVGEGGSCSRKITHLVRRRLPNLGQARDAA
jgi:hypothetical protein